MGATGGTFSLEDTVKANLAISEVDDAIESLATVIQGIGDTIIRLGLKQDALSINAQNTESTLSNYEDSDMASEQIEFLKRQIIQQTGIAALAQANSAPQIVLSLFR